MTETSFTVRFDGPIFGDGHKMAVEDFAPSVMAMSELVKRANELLNGDRSAVRVLIDVDVEQHCFQFDLQIVQVAPTIWEQAKALFTDENIKTAQTLFAAVIGTGTLAVGFLTALKRLRGKNPESMSIVVRDGGNLTQINTGGGAFVVSDDTLKLLKDAKALKQAKKALAPVTQPGYDRLEFEDNGKVLEKIDNEEARLIQDMPIPAEPATQTIPESRIRATVGVRRAVYNGNGKWTIQYDKAREMTIADEKWLAKFQARKVSAPPGYLLDVDMWVSAISVDKNGEPLEEPEYRILKVHKSVAPAETRRLPLRQPRRKRRLDV